MTYRHIYGEQSAVRIYKTEELLCVFADLLGVDESLLLEL